MMADDAPSNATETTAAAAAQTVAEGPAAAATDVASEPKAEPEAEAPEARTAAAKAKPKPAAEPEEEPEPVPDPETCKAIAIGLPAFWESALAGEWDGTDFAYYLEPAGVLHGPLRCTRAPESDPQKAGLLMTRAAWQAKTLYLDDSINPDTYELSFPKEFGYVKPLAHYKEETREHAQYPWSKKY